MAEINHKAEFTIYNLYSSKVMNIHLKVIKSTICANPAKLLKLDTCIMHWVAIYLDKVGIVIVSC